MARAIILKVSYGYNIDTDDTDPLIDLVERSLQTMNSSTLPGAWLVDTLPFCTKFSLSFVCTLIAKCSIFSSETSSWVAPRNGLPAHSSELVVNYNRACGEAIRVCQATNGASSFLIVSIIFALYQGSRRLHAMGSAASVHRLCLPLITEFDDSFFRLPETLFLLSPHYAWKWEDNRRWTSIPSNGPLR